MRRPGLAFALPVSGLLLDLLLSTARAGDAPSTARSSAPFSIGVATKLSLGALDSDYEERNPYAEYVAFGPELEVRYGYSGSTIEVGGRASYAYQWTSAPDVPRGTVLTGPRKASAVSAFLIGPYLGFHSAALPSAAFPVFLGLEAGVGRASFPDFAFVAYGAHAAFLGIELGVSLPALSSSCRIFYRSMSAFDLEREHISSDDVGLAWRLVLDGD